MTRDEVKRVVAVLITADGGCEHCIHRLIEHFINAFPEHRAYVVDDLAQTVDPNQSFDWSESPL